MGLEIVKGTSQKFYSTAVNQYYTSGFRDMIDDHLAYLAGLKTTLAIEVTAVDAVKYQCDMVGFLNYKNISPVVHHAAMRLSGLWSMDEFSSDIRGVMVPSKSAITDLMSRYKRNS